MKESKIIMTMKKGIMINVEHIEIIEVGDRRIFQLQESWISKLLERRVITNISFCQYFTVTDRNGYYQLYWPRLSILFRYQFRFIHLNTIFRYWSSSTYHFGTSYQIYNISIQNQELKVFNTIIL